MSTDPATELQGPAGGPMPANGGTDEAFRTRRTPSRRTAGMRLIQFGVAVVSALSPRTVGALAYRLMFRPKRVRLRKEAAEIVESAVRDQDLVCAGKAITTYVWGDGPRVLLVHGWDSCAGHLAGFVKPLQNAGYGVIGFDAAGHGNSEGSETDFLEYVQLLHGMQQRFGPFAGIIAHSFGAMCLAYALRQGLESRCAVLISSPSRFEGLKYQIQSLLGVPQKVVEDLGHRVERRFAHQSDIWNEFSTDHNARLLELPAMIIHDLDDKEIGSDEARAVAAAWRNAQFVQTGGLGHRRILRDPGVIATAVGFIRSANAGEGAQAVVAGVQVTSA